MLYCMYDTVKAIDASWGVGARNVESCYQLQQQVTSSQQHPFKLNRVHPISVFNISGVMTVKGERNNSYASVSKLN